MSIKETIKQVIKELAEQKKIQNKDKIDNWFGDSKYLLVREMSNDDTGDIGELLLEKIFKRNNYKVDYGRSETDEEKDWDILINGKTIEVKTATIGKTSNTFQHEKFFKNRRYDIVAFIDITANEIYCTMGLKKNIVWKNLHQRKVNNKTTNEFKFDFSLKNLRDGKIVGKGGVIKLKNAVVSKIEKDKDLLEVFDKVFEQE